MTSSGDSRDDGDDVRGSGRPEPGDSWFDDVFGRSSGISDLPQTTPSPHTDPSPSAEQPDWSRPAAPVVDPNDYPTTEFDPPDYYPDHGVEPTAPLFAVGAVPPAYDSRPSHYPGHPGYQPYQQSWTAPGQPVQPVPAPPVAPARRRRGPRAATVVLVAALTALVVGGAAGYGGTRLAAFVR